MLRKKKTTRKVKSPQPGIYITKYGLCRLMNFSYTWLEKRMHLLNQVDSTVWNSTEYYRVADFYKLMMPELTEKEADELAFTNTMRVKNLQKIIVERGLNEYN